MIRRCACVVGRLAGACGVVAAWRHTFKRIAARAGIERRIRFGFCGHTSSDEGDRYETPSVEDLAVEGRKFPRFEV
jgi:hypothetical protein